MGEFRKEMLPNAQTYFEGEALKLTGKGDWRTTECQFHGGKTTMRINLKTGGFCCMSCGAKGGDIVAYQMQIHHIDFVTACQSLGAWIDEGQPRAPQRPKPLAASEAIRALAFESTLAAIAAGNLANGFALTDVDHERLRLACNRINTIYESFQ